MEPVSQAALARARAFIKADQPGNQARPPEAGQRLNVPAYLAHYGREIVKTVKIGDSTLHCLRECVFDPSHSPNEAGVGITAEGKLFYQDFHNGCSGRTWEEARKIISGNDSLLPFMTGYGNGREPATPGEPGRVTVSDEWPDPLPFGDYSGLPDFPMEALTGVGREMVETVAQVNQVDTALPASLYLAVLSTAAARKVRVDLQSHSEPVNIYSIPVLDSGNRKSGTHGVMTKPLYEHQTGKQEERAPSIRDALSDRRVKERRLEALQKRAANEEDPAERMRLQEEARTMARNIEETPVPATPVYLVDDITPEKLGEIMADQGERMALISAEGTIFGIMGGRYEKNGGSNFDIFLKAHAGDPWASHRIGRESKSMTNPALTLCVAVQTRVLEEIGRNEQFRGRGLHARFLYSMCKTSVGYRNRQSASVPPLLIERYREHVFSLMDLSPSGAALCLSREAQALWNEFYDDVERDMRPQGSLYYLPDWGSKLPGAVARIAGLLHLAEHGAAGLSLPISVNVVSASCVIGGYFKEHAIAAFGLMKEDPRFKLARQILEAIRRRGPEPFKGRDVMRHTAISTMEDVEAGLKVLADRGYIKEGGDRSAPSGKGRPTGTMYMVNPKTFHVKNV